MTAPYQVSDYKPDVKTLGFDIQDEFAAPAPPPYKSTAAIPPPASASAASASASADGSRHGWTRSSAAAPAMALRKWVDTIVRPQPPVQRPSDDELPAPPAPEDLVLAPGFKHAGDVVLAAGGLGFQVNGHVLGAVSAGFQAILLKHRMAALDLASVPGSSTSPTSPMPPTVVPMTQHSAEDLRSLLSVITPYAFEERHPLFVEDLSTVADMFNTLKMRPAARFSLARVVEHRSNTDFDVSSPEMCVAWAHLAHKVRSIPTLRKALGLSTHSALREYWLLPAHVTTALDSHLYRALVLVGNTYSLLGEEGLATVHFKYQEGQLCLRNADGDVVAQ